MLSVKLQLLASSLGNIFGRHLFLADSLCRPVGRRDRLGDYPAVKQARAGPFYLVSAVVLPCAVGDMHRLRGVLYYSHRVECLIDPGDQELFMKETICLES